MGNTCNSPTFDHQYEYQVSPGASNQECLHVLTTVFLPVSSRIRVQLYERFAKHMSSFPNVKLWTIECALNDQPFKVTNPLNPSHVQVSCQSRLWIKENLMNILLLKLPKDAKYIAWIDADIHFFNPRWASEAIAKLKQLDLIQLFEEADFIGKDWRVQYRTKSLMYYACVNPNNLKELSKRQETYPHPGYAWAATRDYLSQLGGFYQANIIGSGDKFMAYTALGKTQDGIQQNCKLSSGFISDYKHWASKAIPKRGCGYVSGRIAHEYHGERENRGYVNRWSLLQKYNFDPVKDLVHNKQGVLELLPHQRHLQMELDQYFLSRKDEPPQSIGAVRNQFVANPINRIAVYSNLPTRNQKARLIQQVNIISYEGDYVQPYYGTGYVSSSIVDYPVVPGTAQYGFADTNNDFCSPAQQIVEEQVIYQSNGQPGYETIEYEPASNNGGWY